VHQLRGAQTEQQDPLFPASAPAETNHRKLFWCAVLTLGLLNVWAHRNDLSPDSISYIEIAWATVRGGLHQVVNAYWSPLYPFLLSLVFRYFHPVLQWEFTAAHLLNFAVYAASFAAFEIFLKELILLRDAGESTGKSAPVSPRTVWIWGCVFFLWASYFWLGPVWITPDLCVSVLVYLSTAMLLRILRGRGGWLAFAGLGALAGLGYLTKAAMFPLAFVFLISAFGMSRVAGASSRAAALRTLLAGGVFAGFALPLILALSTAKGRPTFGDVGSISYTEYIDRAPKNVHWQGEPQGTGKPVHATRKIFSDPAVYEFASPIPGSYPPWYDPSYWYEGVRPHFSLKGQLWALFRSANLYLKIFSKSGALWVVLVAVWVARRKALVAWGRFAKGAWLAILPSLATLAMYCVVLVEFRYVAPFALMLLLWVLARMRIVTAAEPQFVRRFLLVVVLALSLAAGWAVARDAYDVIRNKPYEHWIVAQQLHAIGIAPGTDVGYIGTGLDAYWAHLAGVRIIMEIPDKDMPNFAAADVSRREQVLALFSSVGAKAVVTRNAQAANPADGWRQIPGTHHFIWQQRWLIAAPEKK